MNKLGSGALGEIYAARYLRDKGYDIIAANHKSRFGEIDIIAANEQYIVFVEVKTRAQGAMVSGREAVGREKQKKIISTALLYLASVKENRQPRFDVIEVIVEKTAVFRPVCINHLENAFNTEGMDAIF